MTDLKTISELLVKKGKVRGKPVAITLFRDLPPSSYEPIAEEPCAVIRHAMDDGKAVYFDADHHDCLVGVYHTGMVPPKKDIVSGEYLSETSSFFTYEGAARLKSATKNLPLGMVKAIGAAPLDAVPEGVTVDSIVVVANPHNASLISACRVVREGVTPHGGFGTSLCGELFSTPWHEQNVVITFGDFGGRMYNKIKQDQLFVIIPIQFADYIEKLFVDMKIDVNESLAKTKPANSPFWKRKKMNPEDYIAAGENSEIATTPKTPKTTAAAVEPSAEENGADTSDGLTFTMDWNEEAKELLTKTPEGMDEFIAESAEDYAREKGYAIVTRETIAEQLEGMGMNLDEMLDDL
ncbi:MAG: hypothetical protein GY762_01425 [Proteobacteria bacterium]|nr:hypothetical protein [Pseudomonadota bacterium]